MKKSSRINVYLLTGFLGAGKTTVLNRLLEARKNKNNIIIENEFGKVSIDSYLVATRYDSLFELNNGCICCSLDKELVDVLASIISSEPKPDNLFIEASGVADPGSIAALFTQKEVALYFDLKLVICIADASCLEDWIDEVPEVSRQIAAADVVVLNKKSLVTPKYLLELVDLLLNINTLARIIPTDQGQLPVDIFTQERSEWHPANTSEWWGKVSEHPLKSLTLDVNQAFDREMLLNQLKMVLFLSYHQIYRIKGLVWFQDDKTPSIIQTHGKQVEISHSENNPAIEYPNSQLVIIGKGLQRSALEKLFKRALSWHTLPPSTF
ncbi:CobW family GTP-binding protein [Algoriphagus resistens]|uniref:CobW family GTP-binding protein n=1 Tax=Algoriphagus resistens TaxID=1750590 RepID=UPI000716B820|nr:GTP-binding protein [Algoriphagus resistens]